MLKPGDVVQFIYNDESPHIGPMRHYNYMIGVLLEPSGEGNWHVDFGIIRMYCNPQSLKPLIKPKKVKITTTRKETSNVRIP